MVRIYSIVLGFLLTTATPTTMAVHPTETTAVLRIPTMTCPACPLTVRIALRRVDGVKEVAVNYQTKTATVTFDPRKTQARVLLAATASVGFPAVLQP